PSGAGTLVFADSQDRLWPLVKLGRIEEAKAAAARVLELQPSFKRQCANTVPPVISKSAIKSGDTTINHSKVHLYARKTKSATPVFEGPAQLCVNNKPFTIRRNQIRTSTSSPLGGGAALFG